MRKKIAEQILEFLLGFSIILLFLSIGKAIVYISHIPLPSSIIGLILLFIALSTGLVPVKWIAFSGNLFLKYLALLFIPIGVGLLNYFELILANLPSILVSLSFTTLLILTLVGHGYQLLNKKKSENKK